MHELSQATTAPLPDIEQAIARAIDDAAFPENLRSAIRYAALSSGKRLRPLLLIHSCNAAAPTPAAAASARPHALAAAAAIELVHAFSLVHDDLPALDNDDLRRGRPTLHKATSEPMAILAGDAMLCLPFQSLANLDNQPLAIALIRELATATNAMIVGQVHDTLAGFEPNLTPEQQLETVHRNKTGALIRAACRMGALCANADAHTLNALTEYAEHYGLIFQIVDDLLDVEQTTEHLGKRAGKDAEAGKLTFPTIHGIERSRAMAADLLTQCLATLDLLPNPDPLTPLKQLAHHAAHRTR
ncbi:MAG: polyprenyl synthetase family protein [Phycisphaerales bacterium]